MKDSCVILYADDTAILYSGTSVADVQSVLRQDLSYVADWLAANKLTLNVKIYRNEYI